MNKTIAFILAVMLAAALVSCAGQKTQTETNDDTRIAASAAQSEAQTESSALTDEQTETESSGAEQSVVSTETVGETEESLSDFEEERAALRSFEIDDGVERPYPKTDLVKKFEFYRERGFLKSKFDGFTVLLYKDSHRDLEEISASLFPEIEGIVWIGPFHENESDVIASIVSPDDPWYDVPAVFTVLVRISSRDADAFLEILEKLNEREDVADFDAELNFKTSFAKKT